MTAIEILDANGQAWRRRDSISAILVVDKGDSSAHTVLHGADEGDAGMRALRHILRRSRARCMDLWQH